MKQLVYVDALVKELTDQIRHSTGEFKYGLEAARRIVMESSTVLSDETKATPLELTHVKLGGNSGLHGTWWYQCATCSTDINPGDKYCRGCGRAVKWE